MSFAVTFPISFGVCFSDSSNNVSRSEAQLGHEYFSPSLTQYIFDLSVTFISSRTPSSGAANSAPIIHFFESEEFMQ